MSPPAAILPVRRLRYVVAAWVSLAASACASATAASGPASPPADRSADAAREARAADTHTDADVAFMRGMIHHHAQAVVMARLVPDRAARPALRRLGARILNSQKTEIALMADWLRDRGEPVPDVAALAGETADAAGAGEGDEEGPNGAGRGPLDGWDQGPQMPGILSDAQMAKLEAARGEEFDRLFLTYMIDHHDGAVVMVDRLVEKPGAARVESVFRLASGIRADQSTEIDRMRQLLREQILRPENRR